MAHIDSQGFETVSNMSDLVLQGFVDTVGFNFFSKPSDNVAGTRSLACEYALSTATDVSPNFAGTNTVQKNTGRLISDMWAAGGFAFGVRSKFRNLNPYTVGDIPLTDAGAAFARPIYVGRFAQGSGGRIWSMKRFYSSLASTRIVYSDDNGVTWIETAAQPSIANTCYISYVNGFVVASHGSGRLSYSSDNGATWNTVTFPATTNANPASNVIYANGLYWAATGRDTTAYGTIYTASSLAGPWTLSATTNPQGTGSQMALAHDPNRQRVFAFWRDSSSSSTNRAYLTSFDYSYNATNNYTVSSNGSFGISGIAFSDDTAGNIVVTFTNGTIGIGAGTNPTSWTTILATTIGLPASNGSTVAFDSARQKFIVVSTAGYVAVSADATATSWSVSQPLLSANNSEGNLIGAQYLNGNVYVGGHSVTKSLNNGWTMQYWGGNYVASSSSGTANRASRLGIAAINSSGRQSYVGMCYNGDINSSQATLLLETNNAVTSSASIPSSPISTVNPWHYYVMIFTATATVNQFNVQVVVDGSVQSALTGTVQLAPTDDTTSTLYWTLPVRDIGASVLPTLVEFDDIYVFDNSGTVNNTAMLDCLIVREDLTTDAQAQWDRTPSGAASNAVAARALSQSTAGGYVSTAVNGEKDIYNTDQSLDISQYSVRAVSAEGVFSNTTYATSVVKAGLVSGSSSADSSNATVGISSQVFVKKVQEVDPATGNAWSRTAAKAAQPSVTKVS